MALKLLFLGRLEDVAGQPSLSLDVENPVSFPEIAERLEPNLAVALSVANVRVALNGSLVGSGDWIAQDGDEVAFLPPVSGG